MVRFAVAVAQQVKRGHGPSHRHSLPSLCPGLSNHSLNRSERGVRTVALRLRRIGSHQSHRSVLAGLSRLGRCRGRPSIVAARGVLVGWRRC